MRTTQHALPTERIALPRRLLGRRAYTAHWKFQIGETVSTPDGSLRAIITGRRSSVYGRHFYDVDVIGEHHGRPSRQFLSTGLVSGEVAA